jgi:hypothetical protein
MEWAKAGKISLYKENKISGESWKDDLREVTSGNSSKKPINWSLLLKVPPSLAVTIFFLQILTVQLIQTCMFSVHRI